MHVLFLLKREISLFVNLISHTLAYSTHFFIYHRFVNNFSSYFAFKK